MKAKAEIEDTKNLYDYWGERLYRSVLDDSRIIINLASKEYSKCIEKYLSDKDKYITVTFCEQSGDKLVTKGTYAKMARGEMVRYMAEKEIENPADVQTFDRLGYNFRRDLSSEIEYLLDLSKDNPYFLCGALNASKATSPEEQAASLFSAGSWPWAGWAHLQC